MSKFTFSNETSILLQNAETGRYEAVAAAAVEAAAAKLTRREFGDALRAATCNLGVATAVYGAALSMAVEGASVPAMVLAMGAKAAKMAEDIRDKRAKAAAEKAAAAPAKAAAAAEEVLNQARILARTPVEEATARYDTAMKEYEEHVAAAKAARRAAKAAAADIVTAKAAAEKAAAEKAAAEKAAEQAKTEVAPVLAIKADIRPLKSKDADLAFEFQRAQARKAKAEKAAAKLSEQAAKVVNG